MNNQDLKAICEAIDFLLMRTSCDTTTRVQMEASKFADKIDEIKSRIESEGEK